MAKRKERASQHERNLRSRASSRDPMMPEHPEERFALNDVDEMIDDFNRFAEFHANDEYQVIE